MTSTFPHDNCWEERIVLPRRSFESETWRKLQHIKCKFEQLDPRISQSGTSAPPPQLRLIKEQINRKKLPVGGSES